MVRTKHSLERFTDRARVALQLGEREARQRNNYPRRCHGDAFGKRVAFGSNRARIVARRSGVHAARRGPDGGDFREAVACRMAMYAVRRHRHRRE